MATGTVSFPITNPKVASGIVDYAKKAQEYLYSHFSMRDKLEIIDRSYHREEDMTQENMQAKNAQRAGDKTRRTNLTIPIVMPQVESALSYFTEVQLTSYPIFGVGGPPEYDDASLQMETIIGENSLAVGWPRQLLLWFRDGLKYNIHGIEVIWDRKVTAGIETSFQYKNGEEGKPKEIIWEGNCLKRMDMYNTIFDPRVAPAEIHTKGEFAGYTEPYSRVELKRLVNSLHGKIPSSVATRALTSGGADISTGRGFKDIGYYIPMINPDALIEKDALGSFDWLQWATNTAKGKIQYKNIYEVLVLYARIIPSDFDLFVPQDNTPQVWKFIIVNNDVLLYAERLTNAHDLLPIVFGQPTEDGLGFQTKSFAQNVMNIQDLASASVNAGIASKRKLVMDRMFYDPSKIRDVDINSDNPSAKVPVRPTAYGKPVSDSFAVVPYRDDLSANLNQEIEMYVRFANLTNGTNPTQQGQYQKGNKTRKEFEDTMGHSNARPKMMTLLNEYQALGAIKEIIKINILQYQRPVELYNRDKAQIVKIDPIVLRKAISAFKLSDGVLPGDKLLNTEEFQVAMQTLGSSEELARRYRMDQAFTHLFKQRGVDLRPFEKTPAEIQYEQALVAWQQAAAAAVQKGTAFSVPMPVPPDQTTIQEQMKQMQQQRGAALDDLLAVGAAASSTAPARAA